MRASPQRRTSFLDAPTSPRNRDAVTLVSLQKKSVTQILSATGDELAAEVEVASPLLDTGSVLLQQMPMCILVLIVCLVALQLGGFVTLSILGIPPRTGAVFMHLASFLASVTGVRCAYLLKKALSSQTLLAALCKLDQFVFDLKLEWSTASRKEFRVCVAAWILVTALYSGLQGREVWKTGLEELPWPKYVASISLAAVEAVVFMMSSALVITTSFIHSNLLLGLDRALDCYCFCVMADMDFEVAVSAWNSLQALLQCIGREFSDSFFTSQASGGLGFAVVLASGMMLAYQTAFDGSLLAQELAMALPVLFFLALNLRVFYHASSLTEKCAHIPAFVNQIPTGSSIDLDRQYLVRFISDSSPGFVVKDLRISRSMFVKLCIFTGGVLSALLGVLSRAY
ncbi:unnamed protein product [Symbiodinium natans]|uniref:Uncharacterized protein n=1 Tax=Symbiodinium natans TaxID=878477 RepID=A0A812M1I5_9DINO|nr:unnamed protein product [Symbiodinium natans]